MGDTKMGEDMKHIKDQLYQLIIGLSSLLESHLFAQLEKSRSKVSLDLDLTFSCFSSFISV